MESKSTGAENKKQQLAYYFLMVLAVISIIFTKELGIAGACIALSLIFYPPTTKRLKDLTAREKLIVAVQLVLATFLMTSEVFELIQ